MSITNHALVGTAIALAIKQPAIALPLAFASHFVLDLVPHFGYYGKGFDEAFKHKATYIEIGLSTVGFLVLLFTFKYTVWLTAAAAILAMLPDAEWPYRYYLFEQKGLKPPSTFLTKFHASLQWCERPWGIYVEIGFFILGYALLRKYALR